MKNQLLLLEDVDGLGRKGEVVTARPGFVRNFLLPQQKAVVADKHTLKMQARLQEEREKQAAVDRKASEAMASKLDGLVVKTEVKTDQEGNLYGSVSTLDISRLLQEQGYEIDRKQVLLGQPIKTLGKHPINLRLKENVPAEITLQVTGEGGFMPKKKEKKEEAPAEAGEEAAVTEEAAPAEEELSAEG